MATTVPSPPLLVPYRAVGLVSDGVPFSIEQLGTETFVTTAIGRTFQVFSLAKLRLAFIGAQLPRAVTALCATGERTIVACGTDVHVYRRAERELLLDGEHTARVRHLLVLGETLLTVCESGVVIVWALANGEVLRRLHAGFVPSALSHPATYLNKVLLGAPDGRLQLLNVRSGQRIYEFKGWGAPVRCLEQSPALDVVGIGHADGRIVLHNLRADASVLTLAHESGDACNALAFRTDGRAHLVSASSLGSLHVWDLEKRVRLTSIPLAHAGGVLCAHFVRGTAELLTLGEAENALKVWLFDQPTGGARLLRSRSGHSAPPSLVRFHRDAILAGGAPAGQAYLLSGGADRTLRQAAIWTTQQDAEFSQKRETSKASMHVTDMEARRLPPLTGLASSQVREKEWANVLTCHQGSAVAYTWQTTRRALAPHTLHLGTGRPVTSVAISPCGNYGYLGGEDGALEKFNLQSGQRRAAVKSVSRHRGAVRGLATEALSKCVISRSASLIAC